jgi:hypothetical protein
MSGHGHDHDHAHADHHHYPAGEQAAGGPVVLDIGDDRGALIVYLDRRRIGTELHVWRHDDLATTHTGVWERRLGTRRPVAAVFPSLPVGTYTIVGDDGDAWSIVDVGDGAVTETTLAG